MSRALAPTLAVSLVLVGAALAPPADAATQNRAARARTARPAR